MYNVIYSSLPGVPIILGGGGGCIYIYINFFSPYISYCTVNQIWSQVIYVQVCITYLTINCNFTMGLAKHIMCCKSSNLKFILSTVSHKQNERDCTVLIFNHKQLCLMRPDNAHYLIVCVCDRFHALVWLCFYFGSEIKNKVSFPPRKDRPQTPDYKWSLGSGSNW